MRTILQVALDLLNEHRALAIAKDSVKGGADWLEAGTPLIKSEGMEVVRKLKELFPDKVDLKFLKSVTPEEFTRVRQGMLDETKSDWLIVVDGDEIWWEESIKKVVRVVKSSNNSKLESIVVPTIMSVGDIYHHQEKEAGRYSLVGRTGHLNIRAIKRSIPGLKAFGEHGVFGWMDGEGKLIEKRSSKKIRFLNCPHLHTSFLQRSDVLGGDEDVIKRSNKRKTELGISFPPDFYYPEAFFRKRPKIVESPWETMNFAYRTKSFFITPVKKLRRRTILSKVKHGY